jgi:hypothetical protein
LAVVVLAESVEVTFTRTDRLPDLAMVDQLARLQLAARRLGWSVVLRNPCPRLCELLDLVGLAELFEGVPGSALEVRPETESDEELGAEKMVESRNPFA